MSVILVTATVNAVISCLKRVFIFAHVFKFGHIDGMLPKMYVYICSSFRPFIEIMKVVIFGYEILILTIKMNFLGFKQ